MPPSEVWLHRLVVIVVLQVLSGCAHGPPAGPAPVAADALAPRMFDANQLRDGFALGTKLRLRVDEAGKPTQEQRWTVTAHTDQGCTIATTVHDPASGDLVEDQGEQTYTWAELETHGSFPADHTAVADDTITVPAGTFPTRRYTVREDGGVVAVYQFAKAMPGPPISLSVTKDGQQVRSWVLLERQP